MQAGMATRLNVLVFGREERVEGGRGGLIRARNGFEGGGALPKLPA